MGVDDEKTQSGSPPTTWTTRELIRWIAAAFTNANIDSPSIVADLLLSKLIGGDRRSEGGDSL